MPFGNNDEYKAHYKSDHHRYNIKRKMVKLPPVTLHQFSTKQQETKIEQEQKLQCNECR
jgi:pre-60S factor REI1